MTQQSWWVTSAFADDQEAFYTKASLEAERMHRTETRGTGYVLPIGSRGDYWKKPQAPAYHDETA